MRDNIVFAAQGSYILAGCEKAGFVTAPSRTQRVPRLSRSL